MNCPLNDPRLCKVSNSVEISAGRGILQTNCHVCGSGCAVTVSLAQAQALLAEQTAHRPPEVPRESAPDEPTDLATPADEAKPKRRKK